MTEMTKFKNRFRRSPFSCALWASFGFFLINFITNTATLAYGGETPPAVPGLTCRLSYETEADILSDFLSAARIYREAKPGTVLKNPLELRRLGLTEGRFGQALHIGDGWSVTKGTANESGIDLDLIVATLWGDYRTKPHYWGAGKFSGERGTVVFWVKRKALLSDPLYPLFLQSSIAWGRKERDLFRVDVTPQGKLKASVRDIFYRDHSVETPVRVWTDGEWQHVAVVYDQAYGLKLYSNGLLAASNWGADAWWQMPLPGLFSPFLPEADYDEICLFDYPLNEDQVRALFASNTVPDKPDRRAPLDEAARRRLLLSYGDVENLALPTVRAGQETLFLRQTRVADCHDENIPAWWVMDGRYELAWPHPYLLFTFILGDVDFHGTKLDIDLAPGEKPNYVALEGVLDGAFIYPGTYKQFDKNRLVAGLDGYSGFFYSTRLDLGASSSVHFPMLKGYGTPEGLIDKGTLRFPLTGKVRIHEVSLWDAMTKPAASSPGQLDYLWPLHIAADPRQLDVRYLDAFLKLTGADSRTLFLGSPAGPQSPQPLVEIQPLQAFHFIGPDLNPDSAVAKIGLSFTVIPEKSSDVLWISLRDPANPSRLWAKAVVRLEFPDPGKPHRVNIELDTIDLMLAAEDRLWVEMKFANGERIAADAASLPALGISLSRDREKSLTEYAAWEMIPARMQYIKEYNYQPWLFTNEQRNVSTLAFPGGPIPMTLSYISGQGQSLKFWTNFGGPYDMWYPPQAVLRHDPANRIAGIYSRLTGERAQTYGAYSDRTFTQAERLALLPDIPADAPSWAVWERELYTRHRRTAHWIVDQQREDGFFWGGYKDDVFIPLGYADLPLMGDEKTRRSFLREYDGVDEVGAFKDGYCDIWPNDYLHITDILVSRGLMVPYALGDPYVLEREMITARVYGKIMDQNNTERVKQGLPPFVFSPDAAKKEPKLWGEQLLHDYEETQVLWYWGKTPKPQPHEIVDRQEIARKMMTIAVAYDDTEEYGWTRSMHHTDKQGGAPGRNELVTAALGGRLQGRIEPHPHSMVVSWSNPDPDISRLVSQADDKSTRFNLYNFKNEPQKLIARFWRIPEAEFLLKIGEDRDDDGLIDRGKSLLRLERLSLGRFSTLELTVPAKKNIVVSLELVKPKKRPVSLADLAVHPVKDIHQSGDKLTVKIHNIGDAPAGMFTVEALDESGKIVDRKVVPGLASPIDFVPKTVDVTLSVPGQKWHRVVIDRAGDVRELFKGNNEALNAGHPRT
jgi:hypothetical protein